MRRPLVTLVTLVPFLALLAASAPPAAAQDAPPAPTPLPSVELPPELDRVLRDYERAWAARDAAALAALFTPDGFATARGGWVRGTEAIRAEYQRAGGGLTLRALSHAIDGNVGWIVGAYGYSAGPPGDMGKFVLALRRGADGRWLIAADLDSSNR